MSDPVDIYGDFSGDEETSSFAETFEEEKEELKEGSPSQEEDSLNDEKVEQLDTDGEEKKEKQEKRGTPIKFFNKEEGNGDLNGRDTTPSQKTQQPIPQQQKSYSDLSPQPPLSRGKFQSTKKNSVLFIGNLTWWTTDQEIEDLLKPFGKLKDIQYLSDKTNGKFQGCVFAEFDSADSAMKAKISITGLSLHGKEIQAQFSSKKKGSLNPTATTTLTQPPSVSSSSSSSSRPPFLSNQQQQQINLPNPKDRPVVPPARNWNGRSISSQPTLPPQSINPQMAMLQQQQQQLAAAATAAAVVAGLQFPPQQTNQIRTPGRLLVPPHPGVPNNFGRPAFHPTPIQFRQNQHMNVTPRYRKERDFKRGRDQQEGGTPKQDRKRTKQLTTSSSSQTEKGGRVQKKK